VPDLQSAAGGLIQLPHEVFEELQSSEVKTSLQYVGQQTLSTRDQEPQEPEVEGAG
jgi:hypothetical protein